MARPHRQRCSLSASCPAESLLDMCRWRECRLRRICQRCLLPRTFAVVHHHPAHQLAKIDARLPAQDFACLGSVAQPVVDLGWPQIAGIGLYMLMPVDYTTMGGFVEKLAY